MGDTNIDVVAQEDDLSRLEAISEDSGKTEATLETDKTTATKKSPNQNKKFLRLPLARVRHMMKQDPDIGLVGQDAVFLITKATEMFIEFIGKKAADQIVNTKRKTLLRRDVDTVVENVPNLCFLEGSLD